jgi:hypothetical protein
VEVLDILNPKNRHFINRAFFGPKIEWLETNSYWVKASLQDLQNSLWEDLPEYKPLQKKYQLNSFFQKIKRRKNVFLSKIHGKLI